MYLLSRLTTWVMTRTSKFVPSVNLSSDVEINFLNVPSQLRNRNNKCQKT